MLSARLWSVRHAGLLEWFYLRFEGFFLSLHPLANRIGYQRLEAPISWFEHMVKACLFDCKMCGKCVLSATGMSCPMNCPKELRNGPCGGVHDRGYCEVKPEMPCVWVQAWEGSRRMTTGDKIDTVQFPVDRRLDGKSSWLAIMRGDHEPGNPALVHRHGPNRKNTVRQTSGS